ncbi:unnamed protein product [Cladocopium goreaui]|uniref:HECT domain-containing protein n=1 Tax=Cladocopium goreaui TaxID=2562237 RepID=A0A9P1DHJ0_9DINO|nr:unnamed protein product [Cladocopium goreaui]
MDYSSSSRSRKSRTSSSSSRSRKARTSSSSSRSRSPRAKQKASSSGAQRSRPSPLRGRLWGFDVNKYDGNWKGATVDFFRRLQRSDPKDPPFGTYHTVRDEDGLYHSTLQLTDKARAAARLKKLQYKGEGARTIKAAELSATRVLWDDPCIREQAAKLRQRLKAALTMVHTFCLAIDFCLWKFTLSPQDVKNWPAYLLTLLKGFDSDISHQASIREAIEWRARWKDEEKEVLRQALGEMQEEGKDLPPVKRPLNKLLRFFTGSFKQPVEGCLESSHKLKEMIAESVVSEDFAIE